MKKRIFVGLEISPQARRTAALHIKTLRTAFPEARVGWEREEKLHLTLKFLGEITDEELNRLTEAVEETARESAPLKLALAPPGVFPSARSARILWIGVKEQKGSLEELNETLEVNCEKFGFTREGRRYRAHLTIGRIREPGRTPELVKRHLAAEIERVEFEVSEIVVFQSRLQPQGSVYTVVSRFRFGGDQLSEVGGQR